MAATVRTMSKGLTRALGRHARDTIGRKGIVEFIEKMAGPVIYVLHPLRLDNLVLGVLADRRGYPERPERLGTGRQPDQLCSQAVSTSRLARVPAELPDLLVRESSKPLPSVPPIRQQSVFVHDIRLE